MEKIKNFFKEQYYIVYVILLLVIIVFVALFFQSNREKEVLLAENIEKNNEIQSLQEKVNSCNEQIVALSRNEKQTEITNKINTLESKKKELEEQKTQLENEINILEGEVIKAKGQPKTYPAGHLTAGVDIPVGKYKIYGGSSNFIVYSSYGTLQVNIILGGSYGVNEYIYTFEQGDKIEANSSFKLIGVE